MLVIAGKLPLSAANVGIASDVTTRTTAKTIAKILLVIFDTPFHFVSLIITPIFSFVNTKISF